MSNEIIRNTFSVCPVCLKRIPAQHVKIGEDVFMKKNCPEHGEFSAIIWRGDIDMKLWRGQVPEVRSEENLKCPQNCGLCSEHMQNTCCVLLEVTKRCNLQCQYCFANNDSSEDPPVSLVKGWIDNITKSGRKFLQLSGGEPTTRDDLPEIVAAAKSYGCKYVQLNSNGIRLAEDKSYVKALADAGLSFVFLQFDGTKDEIYEKLRNKPLLKQKMKAIENCAENNIGVTLVPTLVPGVNINDIGEIIKLAISLSPAVRGVHFQPVSYFGQYPTLPNDKMRITLPEVLIEIEAQTEGLIKRKNIAPSHCDHAMCGFHGAFIVMPDTIFPLTQHSHKTNYCCKPTSAEKNQNFIGTRWQRLKMDCCSQEQNVHSLDDFLARSKSHSFTITAMAFQDCYNLDLERLRQCSLHVYDRGKYVPFCANYLTKI